LIILKKRDIFSRDGEEMRKREGKDGEEMRKRGGRDKG
jgi:hypothetical protein